MDKKSTVKYFIRIGGTLFIIAAVMAFALAAVNEFTADRIAENNMAEVNAVISGIFGDGIESTEADVECVGSITNVYKIESGGEFVGWAVKTAPDGFKAKVEMIVGVNADGSCKQVKVVSLSETPGLGAKVSEEGFLSQFTGKTVDDDVEVKKNVDEVTGATISSRAVTRAVNEALEFISGIGGEAK